MILVIDDDDMMNFAVCRKCQKLNIPTLDARDYVYAIALLKQHADDVKLIVCDIKFGNELLGGIEFVEQIRKEGFDLPVILVSSMDICMVAPERFNALSNVSFLEKPIDFDEVKRSYLEVADIDPRPENLGN